MELPRPAHGDDPPTRLLRCDPEADPPLHHREIGPAPLEKLFSQPHVAITPAVRRPGDADKARLCLAEELAKMKARRGHEHEIAEAIEDLASDLADERLTRRLAQSTAAMHRAGQQQEDRTEYETGPNGARINRDERDALDALMDRIDYGRGGRRPKGT